MEGKEAQTVRVQAHTPLGERFIWRIIGDTQQGYPDDIAVVGQFLGKHIFPQTRSHWSFSMDGGQEIAVHSGQPSTKLSVHKGQGRRIIFQLALLAVVRKPWLPVASMVLEA